MSDVPESPRDQTPGDESNTETFFLGEVPPPQNLPLRTDVLERGATLGRYVILDRIGSGGMGVVYSAYDPELDRKVALKLLRPDRCGSAGEAGRLRLLREAQAIARLSHPNVVQVYDAGSFGDRVFVAMELVEGRTLRRWLEEERPSWREALGRFVLAGRGLAAAHAAGLVHRDFKPDNVLLGSDGRVRVVDFGLARPAGKPEAVAEENSPTGSGGILASPLTQGGVALGTPAYMAPEQLRGDATDARTDQFSFCISLYEALFGERPFPGHEPREIAQAVLRGAVREPPAGARVPGVPGHLRAALLRGLRADPRERYPSMESLLQDLERDPAAIRRRWLAAAGILLVAAAAFSGLGYFQARRNQLCSGGDERIAAVWNAGRKERVRAAFAATRLPFAGLAWEEVASALDSYTREWSDLHRSGCEATRVRGERSEAFLDRQMVCMDQRLQQVDALAGVLSQADAEVVRHAVDSLNALDSLSSCARPAALLAKAAAPTAPAVRARIREVQARIAKARALQQTGKISPALALARQADRQASGLPYKPLQGEAALLLGDLLENAGEFKASEVAVYRALSAAEEGRDDLLKVRCWKKLVYTVGYRQERYGEAHRLARLAEASLRRAGEVPAWQAEILDAEAAVFRSEGRLDEALRRNERSLAITEKHGPRDQLFHTLSNIGAVYQLQGELEKARRYFLRALAEAEARRGKVHPETASLVFNVGTVLFELQRYGEAEKYLLRSLRQRELLLGPEHPDLAESLDALSALWERRDPERAVVFGERALRIYSEKSPGSVRWALAHNNLAESLRRLGRHDEALGHLREALAAMEERQEPEGMLIAVLLDSLGKLYLDQGRPSQALPPLERAVTVCDKAAPPRWQADARFVLARALWESGHGERALRLAREARARLLSLGEQDKAALAEVEAWLAQREERKTLPLG